MTNDRAEYYRFPPGGVDMPSCMYCKHKHVDGATCEAFPNGIPDEILMMENDHTEPFEGDNGIQFESEFEED